MRPCKCLAGPERKQRRRYGHRVSAKPPRQPSCLAPPPNSMAPIEAPLDPQDGGGCLAFSFRWRRGYFKNETLAVADASTEKQAGFSLCDSAV